MLARVFSVRWNIFFGTFLFFWGCPVSAEVNTGWDSTNGPLLLNELNCAACHKSAVEKLSLTPRKAPILTEFGKRITPQYLRMYLADPHKTKPGTPMPDLLSSFQGNEREDAVESLVHFLVSLGGPIDQKGGGASEFQIEAGRELFHSVGCVTCHQPNVDPPKRKGEPKILFPELRPKTREVKSISLDNLASKTTVDQLVTFLMDPTHVRPSGRMPSMHLNIGEARMIASYLLREQLVKNEKGWGAGLDYALYRGGFNKVPDFAKLKPIKEGQSKSFDLKSTPIYKEKIKSNFAVRFHGMISIQEEGEYKFWTRSDDGSILRIDNKVVVNNDGNHPPQDRNGKVKLTAGRHAIELGFTQSGGGFELSVYWQPPGAKKKSPIPPGVLLHGAYAMIPKGIVEFKIDDKRKEKGRMLFTKLGCVACHDAGPDFKSAVKAPELAKVNPKAVGGCLSNPNKSGVPKFAVSDKQRTALVEVVTALKKPMPKMTAAQKVDHSMMVFNCYACHSRGEKGGPEAKREPYFTETVEADLGEEGRIPPPLTGVGAKLTKKGFAGFLVDGERIRYYMATRMPLFGKNNVGHLPDLFMEEDGTRIAPRTPKFSSRLVDDGRFLVGKKGVSCISCHSWGGYKAQGVEGMDLIPMTKRLQPGWFHAFLDNPQKFRFQTKMPTAWPDGKSSFPQIQGGDAHKQMDAIWAYLSVREQGGLPEGIGKSSEYVLIPREEPIVFRTFMQGIGAQAIAVGFRQRTHVAFDAQEVRLAKAWVGPFVSAQAAWSGRAGQYAPIPGAAALDFPPGPTFAVLGEAKSSWPTPDANNKRQNPVGWQFRGYRLNGKSGPTFLYRFEEIDIEETPNTDYKPAKSYLKRSFRLTAKQSQKDLWFRAARGQKIVEKAKGIYLLNDEVELHLTGNSGNAPVIRSVDGQQELVLPIRFEKKGNEQQAEFALEMMW